MADHSLQDIPTLTTVEERNADSRTIPLVGNASFMIPARQEQPELLDQGAGSMADVCSNLTEMWRINRYFGGVEALTHHLYPLLRKSTKPLSVVDIGTGSGEMGSLLARWAQQNRFHIAIHVLDISARNLSVAHRNAISSVTLVQADACALPFAGKHVDYFISSLFLHHLAPDQVVGLLSDTYHRSRCGIVMSDVIRGYLPLAAFRLIQPFFARHYLTRHDGFLSIKRAYTPDELRSLAQAAGIEAARVYTHFPWRMTLVVEKPRV